VDVMMKQSVSSLKTITKIYKGEGFFGAMKQFNNLNWGTYTICEMKECPGGIEVTGRLIKGEKS